MDGLMLDMFRDVSSRGIEKAQVLKALRALSRWYGGQQLYIPLRAEKSELGDEIFGVMADAIGDADAEKILDVLSALYGGVQWYVPLERNAFRDIIAQEVLSAYDGKTETLRNLCRKYGCSFGWIYKLYHEAAENKAQMEFIF